MCFIPLTNIVFDVYGMNPLKIKIFLTHNFSFTGFSRYGGEAFYGIMPKSVSKYDRNVEREEILGKSCPLQEFGYAWVMRG